MTDRQRPAWPELDARLGRLVPEAAAHGVTLSIVVHDLSGTYHGAAARAGSNETVKGASLVKLPVLGLLMDRVDHGEVDLDALVTIPAGSPNIVGGAGTLRHRAFPLEVGVRGLAELMVQVSDNTATNALIDVVGGVTAVDDHMAGLGFGTLHMGRKLIHPAGPPLRENYVDAGEVTELLTRIWEGTILSRASSDHVIGLMRGQLVDTKYGAVIPRQHLANKTGELDDVSHDAGFILLPGREVALTTTTAFSGIPRRRADAYVQQSATIVYELLHEPLPRGRGRSTRR